MKSFAVTAPQRFRDSVLRPAVAAAMAELGADRPLERPASADLVSFGFQVFLQLAGAVIGLDAIRSREGIDDLAQINREINAAASDSHLELLHGPPDARLLERAVAAKEGFRSRHYAPSLTRRRRLVAEVEAHELDLSALPRDLLTLIALDPVGDWTDGEVAFREAQTVFRAGINTSAQGLAFIAEEMFRWLESEPSRRNTLGDNALLLRLVKEGLRLHPSSPQTLRRIDADFTLSSGKHLEAGQLAVLELDVISRDPDAYGADADQFDPYRQAQPGVYPYGLAFGSGLTCASDSHW